MKKNLFFRIFAAIGMMLAASCSNEESLIQPDYEAQVIFSLGLENGMGTRTISDGSGINQLHFAIFNHEGNLVKSSGESDEDVEFPLTSSISLVKGLQYTAVFWAQNKECEAYSLSEDKKTITVNYKDALNNDETRDAFFRAETFTVTEDMNLDVVLKRPFAQLNVGITEAEWTDAQGQGLAFIKSAVEIKQAATTLNLVDGSVGGAEDVTFEASAIPSDFLKVDLDGDGEHEDYKYLSMCYFLAPDGKSGAGKTVLDDLKFTFFTESDVQIVLEEGLETAPVQRNHRTNIIGGGILTGNLGVAVTLDALYDGEHTLKNGVWEDHRGIYTEVALAGNTIEIPEGWHIRNGYILEPMPENWNADSPILYTKPYTVDGQNHTITFEPYEYANVTKNVFATTNGAQVTVKNIIFEGEHLGVYGGVYGGLSNVYNTVFEKMTMVNNGIYCQNKNGSNPISAFSNIGNATLTNCNITGTYWVGADKDKNQNANNAINKYEGAYDMFVPNGGVTTLNNSEVGRIYVAEHGNLTLSGTTKVKNIISYQLVQGVITVKESAEVTLMDINQYSNIYPPKVNIEAGATIEMLQLNSIKKTNVKIDDNATIGKIIYKDVEYTSIADFKAAN